MSTYDNWKAHDPASERDDEDDGPRLAYTEDDMCAEAKRSYERGRRDGIAEGRKLERTDVVAHLDKLEDKHIERGDAAPDDEKLIHQMRYMGVEFANDDIKGDKHVRPTLDAGGGGE